MSVADLACYTAKEKGRARVHVNRPTDTDLTDQRRELSMVARIKSALDENRFLLYCQPIVKLGKDGNTLSHFEILLRMRSRGGELIPPGAFIPAAERFGVMGNIDRWVLARTLEQVNRVFYHSPDIKVSINLSGESLADEGLLKFVEQQLKRTGVRPERVCFELTETAVIRNMALADQFIKSMKTIGCKFALDDFGSGLSSFSYIKRFPVDYLKIDGSFVRSLVTDPTDKVMVSAINQMGHLLKMETIAEFVEDDETADTLIELGIEYAQGYNFGRPAPFVEGVVEHAVEKLEGTIKIVEAA